MIHSDYQNYETKKEKRFLLIVCFLCIIFSVGLLKAQSSVVPTKYVVKSIHFEGNDSFSERTLKKQMNMKARLLGTNSEFTRRSLKQDNINIKNFYVSRGYLNVVVKDSFHVRETSGVDLFFFIDEGQKFYLDKIVITGNISAARNELRKKFKIQDGDAYNPILINQGIKEISGYYLNSGKLLHRINSQVRRNNNLITLILEIDEGNIYSFGDVSVSGARQVNEKIITREITFKEGETYNEEQIKLSRRRIWETGLFSSVDIRSSRIDTVSHTVDILISVRELDMKYIASEIGFGQDRGVSSGSEPYTSIDLSGEWLHRNMFHSGRKLGVKISTSLGLTNILTRPNTGAEIQWVEPWLFPFPSTTTFRAYLSNRKQQKAEQTSYGLETSILYRPDEDLYVQLGMEYRGIRFTELIDAPSERDLERSINFSVRNDTRPNILYPTEGRVITFDAKIVPPILGNTRHYFKFESGWHKYKTFTRIFIFATRIKFGLMDGFRKTDNTPLYEKFYMGGGTSNRGWKDRMFRINANGEPLGGDVKLLMNSEIRFPLFWKFGGEIFLDGGVLTDDIMSLLTARIRWDAGAGITFATPLGPVRVDMARQIAGAKKWQLQINVLYAF